MRTLHLFFFALLCVIAAAAGTRAQETTACDPNLIVVAGLENRVFTEPDKYWGDPSDFGNTAAWILAFRLMLDTKRPVVVVSAPKMPVFVGDGVDIEAARFAAGFAGGCTLVVGAVTQAVVDTKRTVNLMEQSKKFNISTTARLAMVDLRSGKTVINAVFDGNHETSSMIYEILDKDKHYIFSIDPIMAGGSPLGVPFLRMYHTFGMQVAGALGASE